MIRSILFATATLLAATSAYAAGPAYSPEGVPTGPAYDRPAATRLQVTEFSGTARDGFLRDENGYARTDAAPQASRALLPDTAAAASVPSYSPEGVPTGPGFDR